MSIILDGTNGIMDINGTATTTAVSGTTTGTGLFFPATNVMALATSGVEALRIDSSGSVGIGTGSGETIGATLEVRGAVGTALRIRSTINSVEPTAYYTLGRDTDGLLKFNGAQTTFVGYKFFNTGSEVMRIDSSGNVLVGGTTKYGKITSTNYSFDPTASSNIGNAAITAQGSFGGGISLIDNGTQGYTMWTQTAGADFYIRRATTSSAYTGGVYISNAAGSWSAASDERLKNIISPIENAVEKLSSLRCVIGEYKENIGNYHPFLLAQDVQAVFPEVVNEFDKDNGYLGMSYTDMVPILVKAIQELSAKNDALEARLAALETK
jgi:hypothetical protein